jgi:hypothetical protein
MASLPEVFPPDDPVARFVVSMAMASNDIYRAHRLAGKANSANAPEFSGYVRWSMGFFVEAVTALNAYRATYPEVRDFLNRLPEKAQKLLKKVGSLEQKLGTKLAEHTRNHSFHYPYPSNAYKPNSDERLQAVLTSFPTEEAEISLRRTEAGELSEIHYEFADKAALGIAFQPYALGDVAELREQHELIRDAAIAFRIAASYLIDTYLEACAAKVTVTELEGASMFERDTDAA